MVGQLEVVREEKQRLEKEVHIHELRKEQIIIGQKDEVLETPEEIYRREIQKYNVIPEQSTMEPGETGSTRPLYTPPETPLILPEGGEGGPEAEGEGPAEGGLPAETPPAETETPAETPSEAAPPAAVTEEEAPAAGAEGEGGEAEAPEEEELPVPGGESEGEPGE
jgi:hypothetical protein